jgi:hypothetical protein
MILSLTENLNTGNMGYEDDMRPFLRLPPAGEDTAE